MSAFLTPLCRCMVVNPTDPRRESNGRYLRGNTAAVGGGCPPGQDDDDVHSNVPSNSTAAAQAVEDPVAPDENPDSPTNDDIVDHAAAPSHDGPDGDDDNGDDNGDDDGEEDVDQEMLQAVADACAAVVPLAETTATADDATAAAVPETTAEAEEADRATDDGQEETTTAAAADDAAAVQVTAPVSAATPTVQREVRPKTAEPRGRPGVTCPKSPYLRVVKRVRSKVRVSSTTAQLNKVAEEMRALEKQKQRYRKTYERTHASGAAVVVPPRSVKTLTVVRNAVCPGGA